MTQASDNAVSKAPSIAEVTAAIRDAIVSGDYSPNQRLIEADLSASFGASRAAIRTALLELSTLGLVDRLPNRGSRVRAVSLDEAVEILEVRIGLESLCAVKAAQHVTDGEIEDLARLREELTAAVTSGDLLGYSRLNQELDRRIRTMSRHTTAIGMIERLRAQSVRHQFRLAFQPGRAAVSGPEHVAIIDAIMSRDPEAAAEATRVHLTGVIDALREIG